MQIQFTIFTCFVAIVATVAFCAFAWVKEWLTFGGSVAAAILGSLILAAGSFYLAVPMLFFFVTGSLFGKLKSKAVIPDAKAKKPRDHIQVFCNGGIAGLCMLLYLITNKNWFIAAYFISIAVSTSDTWSSEIGVFAGGEVVDILTMKKLQKGLSGGVSLFGTFAGFAGALIIGLLYQWLYKMPFNWAIIITAAGFGGMLLDSIAGSCLQGKFLGADGFLSELRSGESLQRVKGFGWVTNDMVNLVSNLITTVTAITAMLLL